MATQEERLRILRMIEEGKISAEEGAKLIAALAASRRRAQDERKSATASSKAGSQRPRLLRLRVTNAKTAKQHVNINLPIGLVDIALKIGARFSPELNDIDGEVQRAIQEGTLGKILDVVDERNGDRVEIFVE